MAAYLVSPEKSMAGIRVEAHSPRRAAEFGSYALKDQGKLNGWAGGIRQVFVRNIPHSKKSRDMRIWAFDVMLSQPGNLFDVVGEVA